MPMPKIRSSIALKQKDWTKAPICKLCSHTFRAADKTFGAVDLTHFVDPSVSSFSKVCSIWSSSSFFFRKNNCENFPVRKFEKNPSFASRESNRVGHDEAASLQLIFQIGPKKRRENLTKGQNWVIDGTFILPPPPLRRHLPLALISTNSF